MAGGVACAHPYRSVRPRHKLDCPQIDERPTANTLSREPWNKGKIVGHKTPFKVKAEQPGEGKLFRPKGFNDGDNTATCLVGNALSNRGSIYVSASGHPCQTYIAQATDCGGCALRQ